MIGEAEIRDKGVLDSWSWMQIKILDENPRETGTKVH
jgi:hypothetical protein